jgi:hypothetical protein
MVGCHHEDKIHVHVKKSREEKHVIIEIMLNTFLFLFLLLLRTSSYVKVYTLDKKNSCWSLQVSPYNYSCIGTGDWHICSRWARAVLSKFAKIAKLIVNKTDIKYTIYIKCYTISWSLMTGSLTLLSHSFVSVPSCVHMAQWWTLYWIFTATGMNQLWRGGPCAVKLEPLTNYFALQFYIKSRLYILACSKQAWELWKKMRPLPMILLRKHACCHAQLIFKG